MRTLAVKLKSNNRLLSIVDQGLVSISNFVVAVLIARMLGLEDLGGFVILYGGVALMLRVHSATICMPMATTLPEDREKKYIIHHLLFVICQILVAPILLYIFMTFFLDKAVESNLLVSYVLAMIAVLTQEFVRRFFIAQDKIYVTSILSFVYVLLLVLAITVLPSNEINLKFFFNAFSLASIPAFIIFVYILVGSGNEGVKSIVYEVPSEIIASKPLIYSNVLQWFSGQYVHYVLFVFWGGATVGVMAAVRNIFGPVNVLLLSVEGYLPRRFSVVYKSDFKLGLYLDVKRELKIIFIGFLALALLLGFYGADVFYYLYDSNVENIYIIMIIFLFIYVVSFAWRIIVVSLRVIDEISALSSISAISLLVLVAFSTYFVPYFNLIGGLSSMLLSEMLVLLFVFNIMRKKLVSDL